MHPVDQSSATPDSKEKKGRTPLKQPALSRPATQPATTKVIRRRKRIAGKRTVRSCTSCRAAHVRCVADRYGVPCERCAKKSWSDCSLMHIEPEQANIKTEEPTDESETPDPSMLLEVDDLGQVLKKIASDALAVMAEEEMKVESP
ncbi:hypothetical protein F4860DRAFT_522763 [Xylaria cubensis]|nr:hypothetical protein F4860DRAFT_522763 [Xylaria cubensis]